MWAEVVGSDFHQRFIDAAGVHTRVLEAGTGEPLVLLHGMTGHAETYMRNMKRLSQRFHVIAYDLVGHGFSDKPDRPYTIDYYAVQLLGLLDQLGIEQAYLSGVSVGAWIAAWLAREHPERVHKLVLNAPGNITDKPEVMRKIKEVSLQAVRKASLETVRQRLDVLFYEGNRELVSEELIYLRYLIYTQPGFARAMENILVMQDMETRKRYAWSETWCREIHCPTLLLYTAHDPTGTIEDANLLLKWIPNARLHVIKEAGHWPQWERPAEFDDVHMKFLHKGKDET